MTGLISSLFILFPAKRFFFFFMAGKKDEREKREDLSFNFLFPFISCFLHPQTMKKALKEMKDKEIKK